MTAAEKIAAAGYEGVILFTDYTYDNALLGVTEDGRAVYDWNKMVDWLAENLKITKFEAARLIKYHTIPALQYAGPKGPLIMYSL